MAATAGREPPCPRRTKPRSSLSPCLPPRPRSCMRGANARSSGARTPARPGKRVIWRVRRHRHRDRYRVELDGLLHGRKRISLPDDRRRNDLVRDRDRLPRHRRRGRPDFAAHVLCRGECVSRRGRRPQEHRRRGGWPVVSNGIEAATAQKVFVAPTQPATVFASMSSGVFRSTNGGASWTPVGPGLPSSGVTAFAASPRSPSTVYAATSEGLFRSPDAGLTWTRLGVSEPVRSLAVDPDSGNTVFAGTDANGVLRSQDSGASWSASNQGLFASTAVTALAVDPLVPFSLYASTSPGGLFKSTDRGATWAARAAGVGAAEMKSRRARPFCSGCRIRPRRPARVQDHRRGRPLERLLPVGRVLLLLHVSDRDGDRSGRSVDALCRMDHHRSQPHDRRPESSRARTAAEAGPA